MPLAELNDSTLYYDDAGSGEPLVLVHGAAMSARMFDGLIPLLTGQFRVIAPDLRGLGRSAHVTDMPATAWTDDLRGLLDHLEVAAAHLAGPSLGARIVTRFAIDHPDRVLSLTVDAPILANERAGNDALNSVFGNAEGQMADEFRRMHGEDWRDVVAFYLHVRNLDALQEHLNLRALVSDLKVSTLITRGDLDEPIHPLAHCLEWHKLQQGSWLWVEPNAMSSLMMARPQEFVARHRDLVASTSVMSTSGSG